MALHARGRNHGMFMGTETTIVIPRPTYAGEFHSYDPDILEALMVANGHGDEWRLFDSIRWFRRASTDSYDVDNEVDRVLLLTAIDYLLVTNNRPPHGLDYDRIEALLSPFDRMECEAAPATARHTSRCHIRCALWVLNETRNDTLHPWPRPRTPSYGFESQTENTLEWIFDRCFMALLVGRLVELGTLSLSVSSRAFVAGVERWLFEATQRFHPIVVRAAQQYRMRAEGLVTPEGFGPFGRSDRSTWLDRVLWALKGLPDGWDVKIQLNDDGESGTIIAIDTTAEKPTGFPTPIDLELPPEVEASAILGYAELVRSPRAVVDRDELPRIPDLEDWITGDARPT
jgi:hypothetical protein